MSGTKVFDGISGQQTVTDRRMLSPQRKTSVFGIEERKSTGRTSNILLLDQSGSTIDPIGRGDSRPKIDGIKEAASSFIANLPSSAWLGIISFDSAANLLWPLQPATNKLQAIQTIQQIAPTGTTAMDQALQAAKQQFAHAPRNSIKRLYVLTDGLPDTDPSAITEELKRQGISIWAIGYGEDATINEEFLQSIASVSINGSAQYKHFSNRASLTAFLTRQSRTLTI